MYKSILKIIPSDSFFMRSRMHEVAGELFKKRNEVKYPPIKSIKLQRANWERQQIFYVSYISDPTNQEKILNSIITILYETSSFVRDMTSCGVKETTLSCWKSKNDLQVFVLPTFDVFPDVDEEFHNANLLWEKSFKECSTPQNEINYLIDIAKKFSIISEDDIVQQNAYNVTADFVNKLFNKNPEIDGIMYPSARLKNEKFGINIAFRPEVCDKYLDLTNAVVAHFFKPNNKQELVTYYMESISCNNIGRFKYKMCEDYLKDLEYQEKIQNPPVKYSAMKLQYRFSNSKMKHH